ncbi:hypothetical protein [Bifidobacterium aemilianum]|uniref:hypothetical protein n=1 Tax=Bifidobacterium aemilianum TaxID=2493120 RepID=UPI000FDE9CF7|nr:hypothetical protein [Bifidobacterium aemilianum]
MAVHHPVDNIALTCQPRIVGDHDEALAGLVGEGRQPVEDQQTCVWVKGPSGFVGEHHSGVGQQGVNQGDPMLLTT